jgi:putative autotransporter adhesin-like protein
MAQTPVRPLLVTVLVFLLGGLAVALIYRHSDHASSSTTVGSGAAATQARTVAPFTAVELAGSNNVVIHVGEKKSVLVRGDDNLLRRITTKVRASTLVIGNTPGGFTTKSPMRVDVGVPTLSALTLSGSGTINGSGTATKLDVTVSGSGSVELIPLVAQDVRAAVSGSGSIFITATRRLDAAVSGSGAILYAGHPTTVNKNVTGSGAIVGG